MEQLGLPTLQLPAPAVPRERCEHCGGWVPSATTRRRLVSAQRAANARREAYAEDWARFAASRPGAVAKIVASALRLAQGPADLRINKVWEDCRHRIKGGLDQNHRSAAARWLMANVPELAGRFQTRATPGDPTRARRRRR